MEQRAGLVSVESGLVPLLGVEVDGEVLGAQARVRVRQRYRNAEERPIEAVYTFPLPSEATLAGFAMTCAGRRLEGAVKEREEAFRAYDDAIASGHGAALLDRERPNVFTVSVGNLLPGEETQIEVEYVQRVQADEGALRWTIPTLVAPRYVPGTPSGDRTAHGWAEPTDRVPDADRITPAPGDVAYGLRLDLRFRLGTELVVESPSHGIAVDREEDGVRVRFEAEEVALDRDVVLVARGVEAGPLSPFLHHASDRPDEPGWFSLSLVPDLAAAGPVVQTPLDVVFVVDVSGSMSGASLREAKAALRLCLRHLREGDRFDVIAFHSTHEKFFDSLVPFTQKTLEEADRRVDALAATGGTEMLAPLVEAIGLAPDGVVVLLTDGQVGNEEEILREALARRGRARFHPFGIGSCVSDTLLVDLARRTGGAVEFIHPGERIDEKVVAQFARAIAPRVVDLSLSWSGVEVGELSPADLPPVVDGEPWTVFGRLERSGTGSAVLSGTLAGQPWRHEVRIDATRAASRPALASFWAAERIRDLEAADLAGRRAGRMKERIVELAVRYGIATRFTSFVVVETRTGLRRTSAQPETRVVPVHYPAGWTMFELQARRHDPSRMLGTAHSILMMPSASPPHRRSNVTAAGGLIGGAFEAAARLVRGAGKSQSTGDVESELLGAFVGPAKTPEDPAALVLARQLASGLWDEPGDGDEVRRRARATVRALLELVDLGVDTSHPLHGAQVRKAVDALLAAFDDIVSKDLGIAERALAAAWLAATGARTRARIEGLARSNAAFAAFASRLPDERAIRAGIADAD